MARAAKGRELALERAHLGAENELALREHARDRVVNGAAEPAALRADIDERYRPLVQAGMLIHGAIFSLRVISVDGDHADFLPAHDLLRKPVSTFRDHALTTRRGPLRSGARVEGLETALQHGLAAIVVFAALLFVAVRFARNISIFGEESVRPPS